MEREPTVIRISERLLQAYRSFLLTEFWFRDPELRTSFAEALASLDLVREPYLELSPPYRRGARLDAVLQELVGRKPEPAFLTAVRGDRPLYLHQEEALRRVWEGHNVVVATGTGSGKTEAFLLPILLHLWLEHVRGTLGPGIRALILYPMNALAFDQRERLAEIARVLKERNATFRFTFGQYTGETPQDERDEQRSASAWEERREPHTIRDGDRVVHGELVYRSEMRRTPPHILITNYSMLEYLLIRPYDSPFFDDGSGRTWRFLVVDEAHTYAGVRGQELALLLARLKERLRQGGSRGSFQCIATSATLFSGPDARREAAEFASRLFGEPFSPDDVILGERERFLDAVASSDRAFQEQVRRLEEALADGPVSLPEVTRRVFPDGDDGARDRLLQLLEQLADPERWPAGPPLAALRFHVFVRGLEGAYVRFVPHKSVTLFNASDPSGKAFELALCRTCGQHYLVGNVNRSSFAPANRDYASPGFAIHYLLPTESESEATHSLCPKCGKLAAVGTLCCVERDQMLLVRYDKEAHDFEKGELRYCLACGSRASDPVREIVYGGEWPQAVIATTLLEMLPPERQKLLTFADGRQDAAYFAVRLDQWALEQAVRRAIVKVLERASDEECREGLSLQDLSDSLRAGSTEVLGTPSTASPRERKKHVWEAILNELVNSDDSRSLASAGLAFWRLACPWLQDLPEELARALRLDRDRAIEVLETLLLTLVPHAALAIELLDEGLRSSEQLTPKYVRIGSPDAKKEFVSWDGVEQGRPNRRVEYLVRLLKRTTDPRDEVQLRAAASDWLRQAWDWLIERQRQEREHLLVLEQGKGRQLDPRWLRLVPWRPERPVYRCDCCGRSAPLLAGGVCPRYRCPGHLELVADPFGEENFYRTVYRQANVPKRFLVEEHTAQLTSEQARQYQVRFSTGDLHVLSCSTTFELGVDLGDIDAVFLRNVPPEPFNYTQRAGRVGRRQRPGLVVTFCRNRPHDLYHFFEPGRLLSGQTRTRLPSAPSERVVQRHVNAVVFSRFFRTFGKRFSHVEALLGGDCESPTLLHDLGDFIAMHESALTEELCAILGRSEASSQDWLANVTADDGVLSRAVAEVGEDYRTVRSFEDAAWTERKYQDAQWAKERAQTIAREDVLSFLSRKAVIPKYGFPVDVVELTVPDQKCGVELNRDLRLAIGEYAPGQAVIANKRELRSGGLKTVPERGLPRRRYRLCHKHGSYVEAEYAAPESALVLPCGCEGLWGEYVQPIFGFFVPRDGVKRASSRARPPLFASYFVAHSDGFATAAEFGDPPCLRVSAVTRRPIVALVQGSHGNGFHICFRCGTAIEDRQRRGEHRARDGRPCSGQILRCGLGHSFLTDVVRLDFLIAPETKDMVALSHGLVAALVAGVSSVLDVPPTEVGGSPVYGRTVPAVVLFDDVPGGGGVVARLGEPSVLRKVLESAYERVDGRCGCGPDGSCYACLRTYRNQSLHAELRRGLVRTYLDTVLRAWTPRG
ncbi:MAG: DEAD/DEAH box helicase [Thermomicrobium sp.]|nr:DEAD/DEAH box helicase [Thermomicrobium sp.]MDW7982660.1 DEAD/DEAH box helicase [Thermomicrobium sp.]